MDVSALHDATEELAQLLSEITSGDLRAPTPVRGWDLGELYLELINHNVSITETLRVESPEHARRWYPHDRPSLGTFANLYGGGYEEPYRVSAGRMVEAFADISGDRPDVANLYERQISNTRLHTGNVARTLKLSHEPPTAVLPTFTPDQNVHAVVADLALDSADQECREEMLEAADR